MENVQKDIQRMAELSSGRIDSIHILGGEPLLHPDCVAFLEMVRTHFPESSIRLITNGILLPKQNEKFYESLAKHSIILAPSKYPIKIDWNKIQTHCSTHGVDLKFMGERNTAWGTLPLDVEGQQDSRMSFLNCDHANQCTTLVQGKIYPCPFPYYIRHFNKHFNQNLVTTEHDYVDIYNVKDFNEVLAFLAKPIPFCKYCKTTARQYGLEWNTTKRNIEEWL